jgi:hypothetical protein
MRVGRYDATKEYVATEYMLTYTPDQEKFGAMQKLSKRNPDRADGELAKIPENL